MEVEGHLSNFNNYITRKTRCAEPIVNTSQEGHYERYKKTNNTHTLRQSKGSWIHSSKKNCLLWEVTFIKQWTLNKSQQISKIIPHQIKYYHKTIFNIINWLNHISRRVFIMLFLKWTNLCHKLKFAVMTTRITTTLSIC